MDPETIRLKIHSGIDQAMSHPFLIGSRGMAMLAAQQKFWDQATALELQTLIGFLPDPLSERSEFMDQHVQTLKTHVQALQQHVATAEQTGAIDWKAVLAIALQILQMFLHFPVPGPGPTPPNPPQPAA